MNNLTKEQMLELRISKIDDSEAFAWVSGREGKTIVSNFGRVFSLAKNSAPTELKQNIFRGYKQVSLCSGNKTRPTKVHRLVARHFVPGYQEDLTVNHKDLDKLNNHHSNLEWVSNSDNVKHGWKNGAFINTGIPKPVIGTNKETGKEIYLKSMAEGKKHGFKFRGISQCINNVKKTYKGHYWRLAGNQESSLALISGGRS